MSPSFQRRRSPARFQRGVYAIEFAFVYLLFFALVYATLCYGVLFTMRAGLQHAAEDGARAALRYQVAAPGASQWPLRRAQAATTAAQRVAGWFTTAPVVAAQICQTGTGNCSTPVCGAEWDARCQVVVTVTASGFNQMLPVFHFAMPDTLVGQASMLLDGRSP
ncbi:MAG: pilus assembly protein [Comamonadaceae bacterium]|nr:MAG: pilus assembly protein [Comamonadaceae bacterium]